MEVILDFSKWLGAFVIQKILPKRFERIIEPGSDLSTALGALIIVLFFSGSLFVISYLHHFLEVDKCLDLGGRWLEEKNVCEGSRLNG